MVNKRIEYQVREGLKIGLTLLNYDVRVYGTEGIHALIEVQIDSEADEGSLTDFFLTEFDKKHNQLKIREVEHRHSFSVPKVRLRVGVPFLDELEIEQMNGGIEIKKLNCSVRIKNENGKVIFKEIQGSANLKNENGALHINGFDGKLSVKTENGMIEINDGRGTIKAKSENGQIRILDSEHHQVEVESENGSIFYQMPALEKGNYSIRNENGKIHLIIPADLSFSLRAANRNGRFHIGLPDNYETQREKDFREVRIVRGAGKVEINLRNENGSIDILDDKSENSGGDAHRFSYKYSHRQTAGENPGVFISEIFNDLGNMKDPEFKDKLTKKILVTMQSLGTKFEDFPEKMRKKYEHYFKEESEKSTREDSVSSESESKDNETAAMKNTAESSYHELEERVLKMLEEGIITTEEAEKLLNTLRKED